MPDNNESLTIPDRVALNPTVAARYSVSDKRDGDVEYVRVGAGDNAQDNADDLVAQLVAIDGPCKCRSVLCKHWQAEAGIILTAAIITRHFAATTSPSETAVGDHARNPDAFCLACNEHPCRLSAAPVDAAGDDEISEDEHRERQIDAWLDDPLHGCNKC